MEQQISNSFSNQGIEITYETSESLDSYVPGILDAPAIRQIDTPLSVSQISSISIEEEFSECVEQYATDISTDDVDHLELSHRSSLSLKDYDLVKYSQIILEEFDLEDESKRDKKDSRKVLMTLIEDLGKIRIFEK